jgi:hypothetical protein
MSTSPVGSPTPSRPSSTRASSRASLKLDLSNLPPLTQPTPPTNTLLFTNLQDLQIFRPDNLQTIRDLISQTAPIYTWTPLKSFRRIIVSFHDEQAAIRIRSIWDGENIMGERCRVYFGQHTPLNLATDQHLALPDPGKLFFISPPPSPPEGWEDRLEGAPNKEVHADDLASALEKLSHHSEAPVDITSPISPGESMSTRSRSSTLIFQREQQIGKINVPAIAVDDFTDSPPELSPPSPWGSDRDINMAHTARPPVELMNE